MSLRLKHTVHVVVTGSGNFLLALPDRREEILGVTFVHFAPSWCLLKDTLIPVPLKHGSLIQSKIDKLFLFNNLIRKFARRHLLVTLLLKSKAHLLRKKQIKPIFVVLDHTSTIGGVVAGGLTSLRVAQWNVDRRLVVFRLMNERFFSFQYGALETFFVVKCDLW